MAVNPIDSLSLHIALFTVLSDIALDSRE